MNWMLKVFLLGFAIAAPVGPIGVLCIRRTLIHGRLKGFFSSLEAAAADMFYAGVIIWGLNLVQDFLFGYEFLLRLLGGLFLLLLGIEFDYWLCSQALTNQNVCAI
jgi:threonine/homoserine/homoserine lactone efflux protein